MTQTKLSFRTALPQDKLYRSCDASQFQFKDTSELGDGNFSLGQERATEAFDFALNVAADGYNIYAMGIPSSGREKWVTDLLENKAREGDVPSDWCYVNDFAHPNKPQALSFPPGEGQFFCHAIKQLVDDLRQTIPGAFESSDYQGRRQALEQATQERQANALSEVSKQAKVDDIELLATTNGFTFAPLKDGKALSSVEFKKLSSGERQEIEKRILVHREILDKTARQFPLWQRELSQGIKVLDQEVTLNLVENLMDETREYYRNSSSVGNYLKAFQDDVVENVQNFLVSAEELAGSPVGEVPSFSRYQVNYFIAQKKNEGAPVVYVDNPSLANLLGRVEYKSQFGVLSTDITLMEPGALHRASGGYLIVDVDKVLTKPFAWEALKRALKSKKIKIDTLENNYGLASAVLLEPEALPLNVKVVLVGDHHLYYLLSTYDQEFRELFRVGADFDDRIERNDGNNLKFAGLIADVIRDEQLTPLVPSGVARVVEYCARKSGDPEKITLNSDWLRDLLVEADYQAKLTGQVLINAQIIEKALACQNHRRDRVRERYYEQIENHLILVDTQGAKVGQINGLSVIDLGNFSFGNPARISAQVRMGSTGILDIEREVKLGGALHSKGVLILSSFLASRFTRDVPLSLSASLVFEQSYGGIDGDSASSAELYALLSSLANLPLRQDLAVTGSLSQFGQVQAIGGVNEKIEGFFDVCKAGGLSGTQGVIIPESNVRHLMLKKEVLDAVARQQFFIYAVETIDEGIELLTGVVSGEKSEAGDYPEGSVNFRVAERLKGFSIKQRAFSKDLSVENK
ncbi:MAG: AAA family ATPase [Gammaproteobacteria bacterium]|nr:AAA family ATPase [Gammaproteobacteria bacterium]